ncbi:hypothetical protein WS9_009565 [Paraclostridium sordellii 8483]|uniref:hypothetical protein n=1 Tax=Paraclostridium sordellii TaxID=1505 RepID=UPI0002DD3674|nr:hypothetical protein [Paeniclostridium sordellii]TAN66817.1 hypothetical protein WS9_009565 [Paeniclostridium sordellii 8483]
MTLKEQKINVALELAEMEKYDYELCQKIKQLIINARELQALRQGEMIFSKNLGGYHEQLTSN